MTIDEKLDLIMSTMQAMQQDIKQDIVGLKQDVVNLKQDVAGLKQDVTDLKQDISEVKHKVTCIELTLENELQVNIRRVAEGHVDLFRNMAELKVAVEVMNSKLEMNDIYITHHDSEIKKLKVL